MVFHVDEKSFHFFPPVEAAHVHQRIDVDVGIAGMAEDHTSYSSRLKRCSDSAHIVGKAIRRNCPVLDELHRLEIGIEAREDRTGGVAQLPYLSLLGERERD